MSALCKQCMGLCCQVLYTVRKDTHTKGYNDWMRLHENVKELGDYFLVMNKCKMLSPRGRCMKYRTRPQHCRDYDIGGPHCQLIRRLLG